jgi:hyaluronate lyase
MQVVRSALIMSTYAPAEYKDKLLEFVKTVMVSANSAYLQYMPLPFIQMAQDVFTDTSILTETAYETARVFGSMDRIVQHTSKYGVCIALSSTRMAKYESINDANETGWYQGDGVIYVYIDGNDFGQWGYNWYASPYLMPGTTVNLLPRVEKTIHPAFFGSSPYAGGVEQGKYASAGYILGYSDKAYSSGTFSNVNATKISAKKSYFLFDNEIVCIGSDITDISGADVVTVVENRTWGLRKNVPVTDILHINGQMISPVTVDTGKSPTTAVAPQTSVKARTMHFTGMGGYVFMRYSDDTLEDLDGNTVYYQKAKRYPFAKSNATNMDASNNFLEIVINHGKGDSSLNGKYAYVMLPGATVEETEQYADDSDVILLRRISNVHAVLEKKLGIVAANFFNENIGEKMTIDSKYAQLTAVKSIMSDTPASIMISKGEDGQYHISASEPTQTFRQLSFEIEIEGVSSVVSKDAGVTATFEGGILYLTVTTDGSSGATFDLTVK